MKSRNILFDGLDTGSRLAFVLKLVVGLVWFGLAFGGALLLEEANPALRLTGLVAVAGPPMLWLLELQRRARVDELEARLSMVAQAQGCWWAVTFGAVMYAINAFSGDGVGAVLLALLPPGAFLFGETMAQVARAALQRGMDRD